MINAVVTGASLGIGQSIAVALAKEGAQVALVARRQCVLKDMAADCGPRTFAFSCDVTDDDSVRALAAKVTAHFKTIDVLVMQPELLVVPQLKPQPWRN
jgi:NAD(P)-dependent dehydrogenase (short-subunit alcohol dehydrogenase family)